MLRRSALKGHHDPVVRLALLRPTSSAAEQLVTSLIAILGNNVQRLGPISAPGTTVFFDSLPFALEPNVVTGSPAVLVTGSMTVVDTEEEPVLFSLVRDRGTGSAVVLARQHGEAFGGEGSGLTTITLAFLDTEDTVDAVSGLSEPLEAESIHTYSIVATGAGTLSTETDNALVLLEQQVGGSSFTVGASGNPVDLATAAEFASFASGAIGTTGNSTITGNVGTAGPSTGLTGFALAVDPSGQFSRSLQVTGDVFADNYAAPTPAKVTQAAADVAAAYTDASTRSPTSTNLAAGHLGGQTITPGVYKWTTAVEIGAAPAGPLTLNGPGIYILQVAGTFDLTSAIVLENGAEAGDVFVAVAGAAALGAGSAFVGQLLADTTVAAASGATVAGRVLAEGAITLVHTTIVQT